MRVETVKEFYSVQASKEGRGTMLRYRKYGELHAILQLPVLSSSFWIKRHNWKWNGRLQEWNMNTAGGGAPDVWRRTLPSTSFLTLGNEFSPHRNSDKYPIDNKIQYFVQHVGFIFENLKNIPRCGLKQNEKAKLRYKSNSLHMYL